MTVITDGYSHFADILNEDKKTEQKEQMGDGKRHVKKEILLTLSTEEFILQQKTDTTETISKNSESSRLGFQTTGVMSLDTLFVGRKDMPNFYNHW